MSYLHINNLYKEQTILMMKECYALEKVHGASAHISFKRFSSTESETQKPDELTFFSGGEKHAKFVSNFDQAALLEKFIALGHSEITVYGEVYGGSCKGMKDTYGAELRFIAFDVLVGGTWLDVPNANDVADKLGLEFVPWKKLPTDLAILDKERDSYSEVAVRRGMGLGKEREGIILRPLMEMKDNRGNRVIAKHKGAAFNERATPQKVVDPNKLVVLREAQAIADEWVVAMRLEHVLQKLPEAKDLSHTSIVIKAMLEDVRREAAGEIVESPEVLKQISRRAAELWKARVGEANV